MLACGPLLLCLVRVAGSVRQMQRDESALRGGLDLATTVREQYIHAAHTIIVGDRSHLSHYADWVGKVREGTGTLRALVPAQEQWRVDRIDTISRDMNRLFLDEIVPGVIAGDRSHLLEAHRQLDENVAIAAADADIVARSLEARMSNAHVDARHITYLAVALAALGMVLLIVLAIVSTRNLRAAVLRPLGALADAARRIGAGDFGARVAVAAEGELGLVASAFDQMAEQLSEHQTKLVANERLAAIGQLAAGVAHEINNPIGVIRGYLRTMIPEAERPELRKELRILDEEAAACQRIADDLVAYARAPEIARRRLDLGALIAETATRFQASGEGKGSEVRARAEPALVSIDEVRIRQVLQNLLRNAVQAAPSGSLIEVHGEASTRGYTIRVLDRGHGIPADLRSRIFEPFVSGRPNGTGLGLAVCNGILRAHGGSIEARDREGGGSEFVVRLPP
jgi:signal transduction histidine kinase